MEAGTKAFWAVVLGLLCASAFFGTSAEQRRRAVQRGESGTELSSGDEVRLAQVVDGDTLLVDTAGGKRAAIRLLGIKAFDDGVEKATGGERIDRAARARLQRLFEGHVARVQLSTPPKDRHGRFLAQLFVADEDVALALLREGLVLVYAVYPFENMGEYFAGQELARAQGRGLWRDPEHAERANRLLGQWQEQSK